MLTDPARVAAVAEARLHATAAQEAWDRLARMAAQLVGAPIALITLVSDEREYRCSWNAPADAPAGPASAGLDDSICQFVVAGRAPLLIDTVREDPRVATVRHLADRGVAAYAGVPLRSPQGHVLGAVCVIDRQPRRWTPEVQSWLEQVAAIAADELELRDVSRRAREEADRATNNAALLQQNHELLQRLSAQVPGVLYLYRLFPDGRSCFPYASDAMHRIYGLSPESVREDASAVFAVLHPEDFERIVASIQASAAQLSRWQLEYRTVIPGHGVEWRRGDAQPERLADGSILWHGYISDITEEVARRQAHQELEVQLSHASKMEAVGTLAGGIAHDFNNVLVGILGSVEVARSEVPAEHPAQVALEDAYRAAKRARELVAQILAFSRRRAPVREPLVVWPLLEEAWRLMRATLPATMVMESAVDDPTAVVLADATQLHQVMLNLCTNAAASIADGRGRLHLRQQFVTVRGDAEGTVEPLAPGAYVRFSISDTGAGMDEATRRRIFEPFFTTKEHGAGTGIGLTTVYTIVKSHGGGVGVVSEPGVGTTMSVYLPLHSVGAPDAATVATTPTGPAPSHAGLRVLVVDDEEVVGRAADRLLRRLGCEPTIFSRPREALEWIRAGRHPVDVVITDLTMPEMNGIELAAVLHDLRPGLPVILSTGLLDDPTRSQLSPAAGLILLGKPYTLGELSHALGVAAASRRAAATSR